MTGPKPGEERRRWTCRVFDHRGNPARAPECAEVEEVASYWAACVVGADYLEEEDKTACIVEVSAKAVDPVRYRVRREGRYRCETVSLGPAGMRIDSDEAGIADRRSPVTWRD